MMKTRLLLAALHAAQASVLDVTAFGAVGDGSTVNTDAFRRATEAAKEAAQLPVTVTVPAGKFVTGAFNLTSGVTLEIQEGATVLGVADVAGYPIIAPLPSYGQSRDHGYLRYQSLVFATGSDVRIVGPGTLDGNGAFWWGGGFDIGRPRLVELYNCTHAEVGNVTLKDSGFWTLHPVYSRDVWIHDVTITAPSSSPNTDGIDPDSCQDVLIERCNISCGDDHIAIKSGLDKAGRAVGMPSRNITIIGNIHLEGRGVSIGSEVSGGVEDVLIKDVVHKGPSKHGLHIKTSKARGGYVRNVWFVNISIGEVTGDALLGVLTSYGSGSSAPQLTDIRDIHFVGISRIPGAPKNSYGPGAFDCFGDAPCHNVTFTDVQLDPVGGSWSCHNISEGSGNVNDVSPTGLSSCIRESLADSTLSV